MGGGDLNLKKSWHPSTLRNIERVWKAEQKHDAEQKKIEQLQKELAEEKAKEDMRQFAENQGVVKRKNDRLDWMYQGPAALVDRDQYLLGRRVDTTFEILEKMETQGQASNEMDVQQPGAIFGQTTTNVTVDLANKIREDPLFAIRKRETEQKKDLLNNPVRMKQIRDLLQQSVSLKEKKKKKKSKKEKKTKHRESQENVREEVQPKKSKCHPEKEKYVFAPEIRGTRRHQDSESEVERPKTKQYGLIIGHHNSDKGSFCQRSRSPGFQVRKSVPDIKVKQERSRTPPRRKLTSEEMDRRRQEMMEDAKWRKEQCSNNINRYKEEEVKEEQRSGKQRHDGKESKFYRPMLNKAADLGTVESRVKQKMYKIQRSGTSMNENFARR